MTSSLLLSPSRLARYFFHDCESFLVLGSLSDEEREVRALPSPHEDTSEVSRAIQEQGYAWEEEVLRTYLSAATVHVAQSKGRLSERFHTVQASLELLRTAAVGDFIYQPSFDASPSFYTTFELDPTQVHMARCRPDLLEIIQDEHTGKRKVRVIDLKRGEHLRSHYTIQLSLYALILDDLITCHNLDSLMVDQEQGAIWLGHHDAPTSCRLDVMIPHVRHFLMHEVNGLVHDPEHADWHVYSRCEWCAFYPHCAQRMHHEQDLSLLPGLTPRARRALEHLTHASTMGALEDALRQPDMLERVDAHPLLRGQAHRLVAQLEAIRTQSPVLHGKVSVTLPRPTSRELSIMLTLQEEPVGQHIWMWGFVCEAAPRVPPQLVQHAMHTCQVAMTPEEVQDTRRDFIHALCALFERVDAYNKGVTEWARQINVQCYVYTSRELELLTQALIEALNDPSCHDQALTVLLHIHGAGHLWTEVQSQELSSYPVISLLSELQELVALPVSTTYQLSSVLEAMGDRSYTHDPVWHYPLGHGLRPEPIHAHWQGIMTHGEDALVQVGVAWCEAALKALGYLRELVKDRLIVYAPKFRVPPASRIQDHLLRKLAFFALYEQTLAAKQTRQLRTLPLEVQRQRGQIIELEWMEERTFKVMSSQLELVADTFKSFLMVEDTPEGHLAQLVFDDQKYVSTYPWKLPFHHARAVVSIKQVDEDATGFASQVTLTIHKPYQGKKRFVQGATYVLYPRYSNANGERIISFLEELDTRPLGLFRQLLHDPFVAARKAPLPMELEASAHHQASTLGLTPSKLSAYEVIRQQHVTALWGPPGTGKTHFLAAMILALSCAYHAHGRPFRVLVTAFTHAAIENVLAKLVSLTQDLSHLEHGQHLYKAKAWKGQPQPEQVKVARKNRLASTLEKATHAVLGATIYATMELDDEDFEGFDLVVMDEASQVSVPLASVPSRLVHPEGRLVFAGDHLQLAPIVVGSYPDPEPDEPLLHRSIFEMLLAMTGEHSHVVATLLENFRMNDVLTGHAAHLLYPPEYTCFDARSASRRLELDPVTSSTQSEPWIEDILEPAHPLTLVLLDSPGATSESPLEARVVARLVETLRTHQREEGELYGDDARFFARGCFIVSPHHSQIRLIQRALRQERDWQCEPFVDTVDKMQGQEADCVIVSYGVGSADAAASEAQFIYDRNRLNVALTRARSKAVVILSRALIQGTPQLVEDEQVAQGLAYMRGLLELVEHAQHRASYTLHEEQDTWTMEVLQGVRAWQVTDDTKKDIDQTQITSPQPLTEKDTLATTTTSKKKNEATIGFEAKLFGMADALRGSMDPGEYKHYVLGLIFLKYISDAFLARRQEIEAELTDPAHPDYMDPSEYDSPEAYRQELDAELEDQDAYMAANVFWVPVNARWEAVQARSKTAKIGVFIDDAMKLIEDANPTTLKNVLPRRYGLPSMDTKVLGKLVDLVTNIDMVDASHRSKDILGRVYEYFLGKFADAEGKRGGQFYTPRSVVRTLVELIEPLEGRIYDPCCGSGGMFVQSLRFIESHGGQSSDVSIYGQESNPTTWKLGHMNLAIRGISADLGEKHADTFHEDLHHDRKFDYVLANPPFNISEWSGELLEKDARWKGYAVPPSGNANYAWILHIVHHLTNEGVAAIVMANGSMSSTTNNEGEIRKQLVENNLVDCMVALPGQLFYNTQIPVCIWVLAKHRGGTEKLRERSKEILFIDARKMGHMETRTHKAFTDEEIEQIGKTYHDWRSKEGDYEDVPGYSKAASLKEIEQHGFVLTPGRYVGAEELEEDDEPFEEKMERLENDLRLKFEQSKVLDKKIINLVEKFNDEV